MRIFELCTKLDISALYETRYVRVITIKIRKLDEMLREHIYFMFRFAPTQLTRQMTCAYVVMVCYALSSLLKPMNCKNKLSISAEQLVIKFSKNQTPCPVLGYFHPEGVLIIL